MTACTHSSLMPASLQRQATASPVFFSSSNLSMYMVFVASMVSYSQSSAWVSSELNVSRAALEMYAPYTLPSLTLSRMLKMYDSKSFFRSSVSMISFISACMWLSLSMSLCKVASSIPGVPEVATLRSVFLVRVLVFLTSTHSNLGSFFFSSSFAGLLTSGFSSALSSDLSAPFSEAPFSADLSASSGAVSSLASGLASGLASASAAGAGSPSCGCPAASAAGASSSCSGLGGSSRFSLTTSSYVSSSTSCAPSTWNVPCNVSFTRTFTFLASVCAGTSIL
mmetsp:Transcript_17051/g.50831  ORF Transcript_17051/g.50831 Transcript_17051/m.50831 type:complete len:281 (+) Transcript_17051:460-1302(+)